MADLTPLDRAIRAARRGHDEAARRLLDDVLAASPDDERALLWRARVAQDPGVEAGLLRRALALHPDNRWAADRLAALGDTPDAPAPALSGLDDVGRQPQALHHLQCPHCGGQVEIHPDRGIRAATCGHCGSVLDLTPGQLKVLGRFKKQYQPGRDIEPGAEFVWDGERHLVSGWLRYKGWDSEESWVWDEWQLLGESGTVRYLSYSRDEGFLLQTPIHPTPKTSRTGIKLPGGTVRFHEVGPAAITAMAGELTWRPRLGDTLQVAEARHQGTFYSAELTADEVEVVAGPGLSDLDVWRALGRRDKVDEIEARAARAASRRKAAAGHSLLWLLGGLALLAAGWWVSGRGTTLIQTAQTYRLEPVTLPDVPTERALVLTDTVDLGAIPMPEGAFVATVTTTPPVDAPDVLWLDLALVSPDAGTVYALDVPARSGPAGVEQVRRSPPQLFSPPRALRSTPHRLVLLVRREWGTGRPWTQSASVPVAVSLQRVWTPGPFWFAGAFALFLSILFFVYSRGGPRS